MGLSVLSLSRDIVYGSPDISQTIVHDTTILYLFAITILDFDIKYSIFLHDKTYVLTIFAA